MCKGNSLHKKKKKKHGMCNRNFPDKNEAGVGCVRERTLIKLKPARDVLRQTPPDKNEPSTGCVRETPPDKHKVSMGCVRETPPIKMKPAWAVKEKVRW